MNKIVKFDPSFKKRSSEKRIKLEDYNKPKESFSKEIRYFSMGALAVVIGSDINIAGMEILYDPTFYLMILSFFYLWLGAWDD